MKEIPTALKDAIITSLQLVERRAMPEFAAFALSNGFTYCADDAEEKINKYGFVRKLLLNQLKNMSDDAVQKYIHNTTRLLNYGALDLTQAADVRTLVFTGEYDVFTRPEACREMATAFRRAAFTTIKRADHLFHLEQLDTVNKLLFNFIMKLPLATIENCNPVEYFCAPDLFYPQPVKRNELPA